MTLNGVIRINDFSEKLYIPVDFWEQEDYVSQWIDALQRILKKDSEKAALIVEMYDPIKPRFALGTWPIYRENQDVYIKNVYVPVKTIPGEFNMKNFYNSFENREFFEGGSEWKVKREDIQDFLDSLTSRHP